jgi:tripartite-type tricarboxylate transporter receptor subunit TctC
LQLAGGLVTLPVVSRIARGQSYPTRPIALVAPIAAGGAVDAAARIIAEELQHKLQQSVVVENRPGAGSIIGTNFVAKAAPDGYTLLLMQLASVLAKWLNKTVPFDVTSDFAAIAMVADSPLVLFVTPGVGTPHHLAAAWLNAAAKIDITHVPYRGTAPALNDLLAGQISLIWASPVAVMPFVAQGKVRMLAVSTQQRDRMLPQVPTVSESGVPGFHTSNWFGVVAPARVSSEVVARVASALREGAELPDVQTRMSTLGFNLDFRNSDQFRELIISDYQKFGAIIREAGIQPE